jgi:hypothetical protein
MTSQKAKEKQRLKRVQGEFAAWRKNRKHRDRIPESLWESAVSLSDVFSINELSKALRLNHTALKKRLESMSCGSVCKDSLSAFIEFPPVNPPVGLSEMILEFEKAGSRMKIYVKGQVDIASLAQGFWGQQP